jgi:hypothetical protein
MSLILSGSDGLSDVDGSAATPAIRGTDANTGIFFPAADTIAFSEGGAEAARFDSSGNLGIGTTSPTEKLHVAGALRVTGAQTTAGTGVYLDYSSGIGGVNVYGPDASTQGIWRVYTATSNGGTGSEKARITSGGNLLVNTTSLTSAGINTLGTIQVVNEVISRGSNGGIFWENRSGGVTSNSNWYGWYNTGGTNFIFNGASNIASINSTTGAYTALSDRNKKKDFETSTVGLAEVMLLKPTLFRMLEDSEDAPKQLGFIAQDVQDVVPQAYVEQSMIDAVGKQATYIGLNDRPIIAALTKAIQEQQAIIESLKARLDAANL